MKKRFSVILFILFLLGLTACGSKEAPVPPEGLSSEHVTIGIQSNPQFMPIHIAREKAAIEEALSAYGVSVTWNEYPTGIPMNRSLSKGSCQIGLMGDVPAVLGIAAYDKIRIIGTASRSPDNYVLMVPESSGISSAEELVGQTVGTIYGSTAHLMLKKYLESAGHSLDEVNVTDISMGNVSSALESGTVAAVAIWEPYGARISDAGIGRVICRGGKTGLSGISAIVCRTDFLDSDPLICGVVLSEYQKAAEEIGDLSEEEFDNVASDLSIRASQLEEMKEFYHFDVALQERDAEGYRETVDFLYDLHIIGERIDISDYMDNRLSEALE